KPVTRIDSSYNLITVAAFDMTSNTAGPARTTSVFGTYGSTVYASTDHLYLVLPRWGYYGTDGSWQDGGSEIMQFQLSGPSVTLSAAGVVPGQVLNQFSMDEHGAYFRIATTSGWGSTTTNSLYV